MKEKKRGFLRNDIILIIIVICIALLLIAARKVFVEEDGAMVIIKVDGKITGEYPLDEDKVIEINNGTNYVEIKNKEAVMKEADCPDRICINHKPISTNGETIICLPNKVVVEISSDTDSELDAITN